MKSASLIFGSSSLRISLHLLAVIFTATSYANPNPDIPSQLELVRLPTYCQGQYRPELEKVPGNLIANCGGYMNHFCTALIYLDRSRSVSAPKDIRAANARSARGHLAYTIKNMTPSCPIAPDVRAADSTLQFIEKITK